MTINDKLKELEDALFEQIGFCNALLKIESIDSTQKKALLAKINGLEFAVNHARLVFKDELEGKL